MTDQYTVIIVNFAADSDVRRLKRELQHQNHPQVVVVDAKELSLGYGAALNYGMTQAEHELVVCMNPDIALKNDALITLIKTLKKHPEYGMVGPKILDRTGNVQITCSQIPNAWQAAVVWSWLRKLAPKKTERWYRLNAFDHQISQEVPSISGACFAVRKSEWEAIGGADEKLFLYFEEFDLALRYRQWWKSIWFCAESTITHFGQTSTNQTKNISHVFTQSRRYWLEKHYGFLGWCSAHWLEFWEAQR